jgi:hypothetical protein
MPRLKTALLTATFGASVLAAGGGAFAQGQSTYDLSQLPTIKGKVVQYLPTPRGEIDGFILADGTQVHIPPPLSTQLVFAVKPGDEVTIHGLKARAAPLVAAAMVTNDATNMTVEVTGGPRMRFWQKQHVEGTVKAQLFSPRGDLNGVLMQDGTVVHLPPREAETMAADLTAGKTLVANGVGSSGVLGKAIDAEEIGPDAQHLTKVALPRPWDERGPEAMMRHEHHHQDGPDEDAPGGPDDPAK